MAKRAQLYQDNSGHQVRALVVSKIEKHLAKRGADDDYWVLYFQDSKEKMEVGKNWHMIQRPDVDGYFVFGPEYQTTPVTTLDSIYYEKVLFEETYHPVVFDLAPSQQSRSKKRSHAPSAYANAVDKEKNRVLDLILLWNEDNGVLFPEELPAFVERVRIGEIS